VKGGLPEKTEDYSIVEVKELKVYVPNTISYSGDSLKIVDFRKRNGTTDIGVLNAM
jgi:hypothetical protein